MRKRWLLALTAILCLTLLAGCSGQEVPGTSAAPPAVSTDAPTVYYKATFRVNGLVFSEQMVPAGTAPGEVTVEVAGTNFGYWTDAAGNRVTLESCAMTADTTFEAVLYPALGSHEPFLFVDGAGFLNHQLPLTADALADALNALASEGAGAWFPALPTGSAAVTVQELRALLTQFFPEDAVDAALPEEDGAATRGMLAQVLCTLTVRTGEKISLEPDAVFPLDVSASIEGFEALLEASVAHEADPDGITWNTVELPTGLEPGFVNLNGYLYFVQDNGYFLRNADVGQLHFGEDGRYTSGDQELDDLVAGILATIYAENPDATELELLRVVFNHCVDNYVYLRRDPYEFGATGWEIEDAKKMFTSGYGNCYSYAAIFWALARGMGYEPRAVSGTCLKDNQPHGWVIMAVDGVDYFFDPEWQWAYYDRGVYDKDMFMLTMDEIGWWSYKWVKD